jgi:hypothetical protein
MMSDNKLCCDICNKKYVKKASLENHKLLCAYRMKSNREKQIIVDESSDKPTYDELVQLVRELSMKVVKMEEKMEEVSKFVSKKKKKLNVIEWLNVNVNATVSYAEWSAKKSNYLILEKEHIEYLMENSLYETMEKVFEYVLSGRRDFVYPITCFNQKPGEFYVCDKTNDAFSWRKMDINIELSNLFGALQNSLITEITKWRTENVDEMKHNDKMSVKFNKAISKLMDMSFNPDPKFNKMKTNLYNLLKTELNIVELE